jgi:hypothetical protein
VSDLALWLTAQLDHDEQVARAAARETTSERWSASGGLVYPEDNPSQHPGPFLADVYGLPDEVAAHIALHDPASVLRTVAAHRAILAEHLPTRTSVEWPHDTTGKGEALTCPRCQNAEHTDWRPAIGMAGVLPEGFVAPYVLAPCRTLLLLAAIYQDRDGYDPRWTTEDR